MTLRSALVLALAALLAIAGGHFLLRDKGAEGPSAVLAQTCPTGTVSSVRKEARTMKDTRPMPPMDASAPRAIETATFAMG